MTLGILAIFGVLSILLFAIRGFLDQLPDVFASARRARIAWRDLKQEQTEEEQPEGVHSQPTA
ncbi:hypothetical protein OHT52_06365 [Streptomyces sp. NBC_00247]|uniref:hypothetical protein n=1 Tax=Streptomyces sp. NBC_00247 TaxID=2975689 RepID=UPI002E29F840|nr:hypothetical protein [Streptomyces sp. NBC_00247]